MDPRELHELLEFGEEGLSDERQTLLFQLNTMIGQMDDATLSLLLRLGQVLHEDKR